MIKKTNMIKKARKIIADAFAADPGFRAGYVANVAMLLHDRYGITDHKKRKQAGDDISLDKSRTYSDLLAHVAAQAGPNIRLFCQPPPLLHTRRYHRHAATLQPQFRRLLDIDAALRHGV